MQGMSSQRWRARRDSYRPAGETINTSSYEVAEIFDDATPKAFVLEHHYAHAFPSARFRYGLYRQGHLVGVAVFSHPANDKVLTSVFPIPVKDSVELGRLVLLDDVPSNGETWFLGRAFEQLRKEVAGVVSFSDPVPRTAEDGRKVFIGHIGTIYQAFNAVYLGRATVRTLHLLPDGQVINARALQKIRQKEQGWKYSAGLLELHGAAPLTENADSRAWLRCWLPRITRTIRHPGNHRYAWAVDRHLRKDLLKKSFGPYPKQKDLS